MLYMETTLRVINIVKLEYCKILPITLPQYQKTRLEKLLQSCAGFVKCKYGCKNDVIDLKWLLLELKEPARASKNNSPIIIAKDKNKNKSPTSKQY